MKKTTLRVEEQEEIAITTTEEGRGKLNMKGRSVQI